jgi:hypothetical protein
MATPDYPLCPWPAGTPVPWEAPDAPAPTPLADYAFVVAALACGSLPWPDPVPEGGP